MTEIKRERVQTKSEPTLKNEGIGEDIKNQNSIEQITAGWENSISTASGMWAQSNDRMIAESDVIFGYKNTGNADPRLHQIIITKRFRGSYGISIVTADYSIVLPDVSTEHLEEIKNTLIEFNVDKKILSIYSNIIENETSGN